MKLPSFRSSSEEDLSRYILLEGKDHEAYAYPDVLVAVERSHHELRLGEQEEKIHREGGFLFIPRQFVDWILLLRSGKVYDGNGKTVSRTIVNNLLDHLLSSREPFRGERLSGQFTQVDGINYFAYYRFDSDKKFYKVTDRITDCLLEEPLRGISLEHWFAAATAQGFPPVSSPTGRLRYRPPQHERVPWIGADEYGPIFNCAGDPSFKDKEFGMRKVILKP